MTEEERIRMEKESDLKLALETTFGGNLNSTNNASLEGLGLPNTKKNFRSLRMRSQKLLPLSSNAEYPNFTENLLRNLCATSILHYYF